MNALMSSRPRRGSCSEYLSSISGAAISSTTPRLTVLPQNSVNQRPTTALLSASLRMGMAPHDCLVTTEAVDDLGNELRATGEARTPDLALESKVHAPWRRSRSIAMQNQWAREITEFEEIKASRTAAANRSRRRLEPTPWAQAPGFAGRESPAAFTPNRRA